MTGSEEAPKAVIDLGTNTVLMVVGRRRRGGVEVLADRHAIARLGRGVDARRRIPPRTAGRVCALLRAYCDQARALGARQIRAYGTSALRQAANKGEFIARVREEVGIALAEVSGRDEARFTFSGAAFGLELPGRYAVLDIGGGSTELAAGRGGEPELSASVDLGALRLSERHFARLPPTAAQQREARAFIRAELDKLPPYPAGVPLVGVAGTATTLGALDLGVERFDALELDGHFLARAAVERWSARLLSLSYEETCALPQVSEQRADIIAAGALILRSALERFDCPGLLVSTRGMRYGLLLRDLAAG